MQVSDGSWILPGISISDSTWILPNKKIISSTPLSPSLPAPVVLVPQTVKPTQVVAPQEVEPTVTSTILNK